MEQITNYAAEAKERLTGTLSRKNSTLSAEVLKNENVPAWLPKEHAEFYARTDLTYNYCLKKFSDLAAAKRETFPSETMRIWFIEFIRKGWTVKMFNERYDALLNTNTYGAVNINHWFESKPLIAMDEANIIIERRIENMIRAGERLKGQKIELTDDEMKLVKLSEYKKLKFELNNKRYEIMKEAEEEFRKAYIAKLQGKKKQIAEMDIQKRMEILDKAIEIGTIKCQKSGFEYMTILHNLEYYADLIAF